MRLDEFIARACEEGLINPDPLPNTVTAILADTDGYVVSTAITYEFLDNGSPYYISKVTNNLFLKREELREKNENTRS